MNITHEQLATLQKIATRLGLLAELTRDKDDALCILLSKQAEDDYADISEIVGEIGLQAA